MWQQKPKKPQNLQIFSTKLKALIWIPVIKKKKQPKNKHCLVKVMNQLIKDIQS